MTTTQTAEIMGINADTLEQTDRHDADFFVIADVTRDADGHYLDHESRATEFDTYEAAEADLTGIYIATLTPARHDLEDDVIEIIGPHGFEATTSVKPAEDAAPYDAAVRKLLPEGAEFRWADQAI